MKGILAGLLFSVGAALATSALAQSQPPVVMRISHQLPPDHHVARMIEAFAADIEARTEGGIDVRIFGSEQAARAGDNFPAVARGTMDAALSVNFQWGGLIPEMSALTIPYYFTDLDRIRRFAASDARRFLDERLAARGVRNIAWIYTTRQAIFTSDERPIVRPGDLKGLKIRGLNALTDSALKAAGAVPTAMPGSEIYEALAAHILDSGLTDLSAAYSRRLYEVQKYGLVAPYCTVYFHLFANAAWWDGLPPEHRPAILAAAAKLESEAIEATETEAAQAVGRLRDKTMRIRIQTPEETAAWKDAMQRPVLDAFLKSAPESGPRILELLGRL
ncbi:TRAP transporter substrate-binding protein DctP [Arenibaculum pallidiluteum]|uniref:TRAP transporter substrate-binding protein DctP n=1 Tax=Arenibaculum pallidiluteum TaxID=2812559 RepID=UPI002E2CA108|nr:TRAP transporter substrate-binding protein DctP [Arenibaculum pallidiluteum]